MGADIHSLVEIRKDGKWEPVNEAIWPPDEDELDLYGNKPYSEPLRVRRYGLFGWLANVRNYSCVEPLAPPRGLPRDCADTTAKRFDRSYYYHSWFTLAELLAVDYSREILDWREARSKSDATSRVLRDLLGDEYMQMLDVMKTLGAPDDVRIIFAFD